jgi:hypothetical protein
MLLAVAAEVDYLAAGDSDEVADAASGHRLLYELRIENLAALGL